MTTRPIAYHMRNTTTGQTLAMGTVDMHWEGLGGASQCAHAILARHGRTPQPAKGWTCRKRLHDAVWDYRGHHVILTLQPGRTLTR